MNTLTACVDTILVVIQHSPVALLAVPVAVLCLLPLLIAALLLLQLLVDTFTMLPTTCVILLVPLPALSVASPDASAAARLLRFTGTVVSLSVGALLLRVTSVSASVMADCCTAVLTLLLLALLLSLLPLLFLLDCAASLLLACLVQSVLLIAVAAPFLRPRFAGFSTAVVVDVLYALVSAVIAAGIGSVMEQQ
jgi:hypothetical protein